MPLLELAREGSGPPLLWLHGFTQTRASAKHFRTILARTFQVVTVDLPGHGVNAGVVATLDECADLLADAVYDDELIVGGYSFGGRVALHLALRHPSRVRALVTLGATRGIHDEAERRARRIRDEQLADHVEDVGTERFLDEWLAQPLFRDLPADEAERRARSTDATGLANALRHAGTGTQAWLGERLGELAMPYLALAGVRDEKFALEARALAAGARHGRSLLIPDAGHAAHLVNPTACVDALLAP